MISKKWKYIGTGTFIYLFTEYSSLSHEEPTTVHHVTACNQETVRVSSNSSRNL